MQENTDQKNLKHRSLLRSAAEEFGESNIKLGVVEERLLSLLLFLKLNGR